MENNKFSKIKVRVDKSHLFTLGEKMYRESIEFIRELVNNAYDADASEVYIHIDEEKIEVQDNGSGMNERGLEQFFTIGSEEKKTHSVSPKFGRKRIGQFGIGKFSALALADQFIIESVKGNYKYSVIFDRADWQSNDNWELPIQKEEKTPLDHDGTVVILNRLTKKLNLSEVEKYLKQSVPLRTKKFAIYLNMKRVSAKDIPGRAISINIKTMYGTITGEIIIAINAKDVDEPGIECRVKQVFIKRSMFGLDKKYHLGINRVTGSVNADFLPLISSRSEFIIDNPEYQLFHQLIKNQLAKILDELKSQSEVKNIKKITKELQDVMKRIKEALTLNPDFVPQGRAVTRLKKEGKNNAPVAGVELANKEIKEKKEKIEKKENNSPQNEGKIKEEQKIEAKPLVMKKIRIKKLGISVCIINLGETGAEVLGQGNVIYINQDHPLYQAVYKKRDMLTMHLYRLITQEIVMMKKKVGSKEAFEWQGRLIKDAICND